MKNNKLLILVLIISFLVGFLIRGQITSNIILDKELDKKIIILDTCIYQTRTGVNIIPNKEICCKSIKEFFKCDSIDETEIEYGNYYTKINRQCYNDKDSELKVYFREGLENFCKNEGYL